MRPVIDMLLRVGTLFAAFGVLIYLYSEWDDMMGLKQDEKLAIAQAKQGARFTAADGRQVCAAILAIDPAVESLLPEVCFHGERSR